MAPIRTIHHTHPILLTALLLLGLYSYAPSAAADATCADAAPITRNGRTLVWHDEFCQDGLPDPEHWNYETHANAQGWDNHELQYYSGARKENSVVTNGVLRLTAIKESSAALPQSGGQQYTSARLTTQHHFEPTYGFIEVRAKLPCSLGTWPAIWMIGSLTKDNDPIHNWPAHGEIDIMEQGGFATGDHATAGGAATPATNADTAWQKDWGKTTIHSTVHMSLDNADNGGNGIGNMTRVPDACTAFHNYQMTWTPESITFSVDDAAPYMVYHKPSNASPANTASTAYWPFDEPQFLILNLAIGGNLGGSVPSDFSRDSMEVDYVRVYQ